MGKDIGTGLSLRAVFFDFCSTYISSSVIGTRSTTGFDVITHQNRVKKHKYDCALRCLFVFSIFVFLKDIDSARLCIQMGELCFDTISPFFDHFLMIFLFFVFQKDVDSARLYKWAHCALTQEPLQKPVVACELVCHKKDTLVFCCIAA